MVEMTAKETSRWWWFDSHNSSKRSPWLRYTLTELEEKTKAMLKLIEADADSFAQRAEMYYKKRPELISMVEDFYRAHRSLAERYDQVKSETGTRLVTTFGSPFISIKHKPQKLINVMDQTYYSYSGTSDAEDYAESEVDNPDQEDGIQVENETEGVEDSALENESEVDNEMKEDKGPEWENEIQVDQELKEDSVSSEVCDDEILKSQEEIKEVEDPELEDDIQVDQELKEDFVSSEVYDDEIMKLREEIEVEDPALENESEVDNEIKEDGGSGWENEIQVDQELKEYSVSSEVCCDEIMKLREEIEEVEDPELENEAQAGKEMKEEGIPKQEDEIQVDQELKEDSVSSEVCDDEMMNLREEIEKVQDSELENEAQIGKEMIEEDPEQEDEIQVDLELKENSVSSEVCDKIMKVREEIEKDEDSELENEAQVGKEMKEVEDPEQEDEIQVDQELKEDSVSSEACDDAIMKLREEIERLKEENLMQRNQLIQKDEEKREVIRQLSTTVGVLMDENVKLMKYISRESSPPKKQNPFGFSKLKAFFRGTTW